MKGRSTTRAKGTSNMKRIQYHNEKGNVLPKVRAEYKSGTVSELRAMFEQFGVEVFDSPKGIAVKRFEDENGNPVYAQFEVTMITDLTVKEKVKSAKVDEPVEVVPMFSKQ